MEFNLRLNPVLRQAGRQTQTDRQTGRQTDRQADRQTGRQTDRQAGRQTDRQTGRPWQTDRKTDRQADKACITCDLSMVRPSVVQIIVHKRVSEVLTDLCIN